MGREMTPTSLLLLILFMTATGAESFVGLANVATKNQLRMEQWKSLAYEPPFLVTPQRHPAVRGTKRRGRKSSKIYVAGSDISHEDYSNTAKKGGITVSASIDLPFSADIAFEAFRDPTRQPTWSSWLKSVEHIDQSTGTTKWTMGFMGLKYSWNAVSTKEDRENGIIEWSSVTGLRNAGQVKFVPLSEDSTHMSMTMTFTAPRFAARVLGNRKALKSVVEQKMLQTTLSNFREVVLENDVAQAAAAEAKTESEKCAEIEQMAERIR